MPLFLKGRESMSSYLMTVWLIKANSLTSSLCMSWMKIKERMGLERQLNKLRGLTVFEQNLGSVPTLLKQDTTICNCSSRGSGNLYGLSMLCLPVMSIHSHRYKYNIEGYINLYNKKELFWVILQLRQNKGNNRALKIT